MAQCRCSDGTLGGVWHSVGALMALQVVYGTV